MAVRWTTLAVDDFTRICDYSSAQFGDARAGVTAKALYNSAESLEVMPNRGRPGRRAGTRELPLPGLPFVTIYRVREYNVEIIRILHGAQKWPQK